jgi:hypothetical protein
MRVRIHHTHADGTFLEDLPEALLAVAESLSLSLLALADVVYESIKAIYVMSSSRPNDKLDRELLSVTMQSRQLQSLAEYRTVTSCQEVLQGSTVTGTVLQRNYRVCHAAPQGFLTGPAEEPFGLNVPIGDRAGRVDCDEGIPCGLDYGATPFFARLELGLSTLSFHKPANLSSN